MNLVEDMVVGDGVIPLPVGTCPVLMLGIGVTGGVALRLVAHTCRRITGHILHPFLIADLYGQRGTEVQALDRIDVDVVGGRERLAVALILHFLHSKGVELVVVVGVVRLIVDILIRSRMHGSWVSVGRIVQQRVTVEGFGVDRVVVHVVGGIVETGVCTNFQPRLDLCVGVDTTVILLLVAVSQNAVVAAIVE